MFATAKQIYVDSMLEIIFDKFFEQFQGQSYAVTGVTWHFGEMG